MTLLRRYFRKKLHDMILLKFNVVIGINEYS